MRHRFSEVRVSCPVCEIGKVSCLMDPGEEAITTGPSDSWYPGFPPSLDEIEPDCLCSESGLVDAEAYHRIVEARALEQGAYPE